MPLSWGPFFCLQPVSTHVKLEHSQTCRIQGHAAKFVPAASASDMHSWLLVVQLVVVYSLILMSSSRRGGLRKRLAESAETSKTKKSDLGVSRAGGLRKRLKIDGESESAPDAEQCVVTKGSQLVRGVSKRSRVPGYRVGEKVSRRFGFSPNPCTRVPWTAWTPLEL